MYGISSKFTIEVRVWENNTWVVKHLTWIQYFHRKITLHYWNMQCIQWIRLQPRYALGHRSNFRLPALTAIVGKMSQKIRWRNLQRCCEVRLNLENSDVYHLNFSHKSELTKSHLLKWENRRPNIRPSRTEEQQSETRTLLVRYFMSFAECSSPLRVIKLYSFALFTSSSAFCTTAASSTPNCLAVQEEAGMAPPDGVPSLF